MLRWTGAWDDYLYWQTRDKRTLKHVNVLIRDAMRSPFAGLDKPEPLNGNCRERGASHRFREPAVYIVEGGDLCVLSAVAATECFG